jgi:tRNA modification GTPase
MSLENDNIVALATPHGIGAISIIRLSGSSVLDIALALTKKNSLTPRVATLSSIYSQDSFIDETIILYFKAPNSFSGEDIIEIQCHGGITLSAMILDEVLKYDIRLADAGEFSKRAFLNGKIDLSKAETIASLIETKSKQSAKILAQNLKGILEIFVDKIKDLLIESLSYSEVSIDYSDENLPKDLEDSISNLISNVLETLNKTYKNSIARSSHINGFKLSIIGKPNVGKSSLLNKILLFDRAIVSSEAGTTRDTVEASITIGSSFVTLIDTAGIRDATDEIERIGIDKSIESAKNSNIIIAMFDLSKKLNSDDKKIVDLINRYKNDKKIVVVKNKLDIKKEDLIIDGFETISMDCNDNIDNLIAKLEQIVAFDGSIEDAILTSKRQILAIENTIKETKLALESMKRAELEIFSYHIGEAISYISSITKPYEYSQMLDKMFGNFCLGK